MWGDRVTESEEESVTDQDGIKTTVSYKTNSDGKRVKVIRKVRVYKKETKINKAVQARKLRLKKFGDCANAPPGPERGVTTIGEDVFLVPTRNEKEKKEEAFEGKEQAKPELISGITCRNCGLVGDHWTTKCPYKDRIVDIGKGGAEKEEEKESPTIPGGKYVPPIRRRGGEGEAMRNPNARDETATIRVTNLGEDTKEADLGELFRPFGPIARIYVAKDKDTQLAKGFAFVNFHRREDASRAIDKLNGVGWNHLILNLEWAKPSNK